MEYRRVRQPDADWIGKLWERVWEMRDKMPWGVGKDVEAFVRVCLAPDTALYEVGDFQGVVFFTAIQRPEDVGEDADPVAECHLLIWDSLFIYRNTKMFQGLLREFFAETRVHRIFGQVPASVKANIGLSKRLGFNVVGLVRQRIPRNGAWEDAYLVDLLADDLKGESHGMDRTGDSGRIIPAQQQLVEEGGEVSGQGGER